MGTSQFLTSILIAALFVSGAARAGDRTINVVAEQGTTVAEFNLGDSRCVLKDDRLSCTPHGK